MILFLFAIWTLGVVGAVGEIPNCDFFDTENITDRVRLWDGSYRYDNLIIPAHLTDIYDYVINYDGVRESVPPHRRGCVCKLKSCIRLCCDPQKLLNGEQCSEDFKRELTYSYILNMKRDDGLVTRKHILNDIIVQEALSLACKSPYALDTKNIKHHWTLFENGTLYRHFDAAYLGKQNYCMQPKRSSSDENYSLVTFVCPIEPSLIMGYVKIGSIVLLAITIGVYLWLPRFRSLHGKCCISYFFCLMTSYLMNVFSMFRLSNDDHVMCQINGYGGYFVTMATFLWLFVISLDIWRRLGLMQYQELYRNQKGTFLKYNLFVWSISGVLALAVFLVDRLHPFPEELLPAVGVYYCWIMTERWSGMIYLYAPVAVLVIFNLTMFALIAWNVYAKKVILPEVLDHSEENENSRKPAGFGLYLYLFIIMGGFWLMEVLAFVCERKNVLSSLVIANDIVICGQGIIIFLICVCHKEVFNSIRDRLQPKKENDFDFSSGTMDFNINVK